MAKRKNKKIIVKRNRLKGNTAIANRKYKDTVFRMLFSDRKNLLSLYNAINETSYTDAAQLEIVTLENAIYMGMKNDLAFIINTNLFLYEHQSTYNPNMPLSSKIESSFGLSQIIPEVTTLVPFQSQTGSLASSAFSSFSFAVYSGFSMK